MGPLTHRREFLATLPAAFVAGTLEGAQPRPASTDPLGVRNDFPAADELLYLDSAYITPTPTPVVEAGKAFAESKGRRPIPLGDMLRSTDRGPRPVRAADWRLAGRNRLPVCDQ